MKPSKGLSVSEATIKRTSEEVERFIDRGDWQPASPYHLVALYMICHEETYGVPATELKGQEFGLCAHVAKAFIIRNFNGSIPDTIPFIRWAWAREAGKEKWRAEKGITDGRRFGWKLQFSDALLTDYRIHLRREEEKKARQAGNS